MEPRDIRVESPSEALFAEQALAMYREMKCAAEAAPDGKVLAQAEQVAVVQGRELLRKGLEAVLNEQAQGAEKRGRRAEPVPAAARANTVGVTRGRC
jgi:hypothetical protein